MSDFVNSLFSRSFERDDGRMSIRPRLPSLFETPLTTQADVNARFTADVDKIHEEISLAPKPEPTEPDLGVEGPVSAVSQREVTNERVELSDGSGRLEKHKRANDVVRNPIFSEDRKFPSQMVRPLIDASVHGDGLHARGETGEPSEHKHQHGIFADSAVPAGFEPKPEFNTTQSPMSLSLFERKSQIQTTAANKADTGIDAARVVVDPSVLERIVKGHMTSYAKRQFSSERDETLDSARSQLPELVSVDASKLTTQRPHALTNRPLFDNDRETLSVNPEPVINVTIGRIEIRATQTAPTSARKSQAPKQAAMSLDDYLNKRNGAAR